MKRARRLLLFAFAISLLVHVLVALIARPPSATLQSNREVVSVIRRSSVAVAKRPPPPPRPTRTPSPFKAAPHPRSHLGTTAASGGGARAATPAPPVQTPPPAVAKAGCSDPNAAAAVVATPSPPDIPASVRADATTGDAVVSVQLDTQGQVLGANVTQSTGNSSLDLVAVSMARDARYAPGLRDCKPVAANAIFSVKFVAW
jgi:TonB family protein